MDVKRIWNYQPQFNGYVDKSVKKYVNKAIKNECSHLYKEGTLDLEKMQELEDYGKDILINLSQYMAKTDKNTKFTLGDTSYIGYPRLKNPISSHTVRIYSPLVDGNVRMDEFGDIAMPKTPVLNSAKNARDIDLVKLERYYKKLNDNIDPREIDKSFYLSEKAKLDETSDEKLGFFAGIFRTFKEAKLESFFERILILNR